MMIETGQPNLSVVIPAYNEQKRLKTAIPSIVSHLRQRGRPFEIIVVNDGSRDDTARVTQELTETYPMIRLITLNHNRGKGAAVRAGMLAACGRYVLFTDADQSTSISELEKLSVKLERESYDIAIGSRAVSGADVQAQPWYRVLAGKLFGLGTRLLVLGGVADTQCGFKCMKREAAQKVFPQVTSDTAIFDVEMLVVASREGYRVAEVPVTWVHDPDTRIPYNLRRVIGIWAELFRIKRAQRVGWPLKTWK
jgi:dolichyl-phosphate beta-glucosyltransferase